MSRYTEDKKPYSVGDRITLNKKGMGSLSAVYGLTENDVYEVKELQWQNSHSQHYGHLIIIKPHRGNERIFDAVWEMFTAIVETKNWEMEEPDFSLDEIHEAQAAYEKING